MRAFKHVLVATLTAMAVAACGQPQEPGQSTEEAASPLGSHQTRVKGSDIITGAMSYHGGPVVTGTPTVYYIFYGSYTSTQQSYLKNFMANLSGSGWERINTTYYNGSGTHVSGYQTSGTSVNINEYLGTSLSDSQILQIVSDVIYYGYLPYNSNGLYFVLTSPDVHETSGFCSAYCGWHSHGNIYNGSKVRYSFVGNPATQCMNGCAAQTVAPSGDPGTSAMTSIMAHEAVETFSDPDGNAWYDAGGNENADKCAWSYGTTYTASNGAKYNITLGGVNYLIQQNWVNSGSGYCAMSY